MRALNQWVLWKAEDIGAAKLTKVPYSINGSKASVTNSNHWSSFDEVAKIFASGIYSGIGFVFSQRDPYTFIDLDHSTDTSITKRQHEIYGTFNSYSELSPSGQGLHIIVKGSVPQGRRRECIEIYSNERYATFTGNVYLNEPIKECQSELMSLWEQLGGTPTQQFNFQGDADEKQSDQEIIRIASEAVNGDKFQRLYKGDWGGLYPSQSEADFSLINMIEFYTKNKAQIVRIFRSSELGKRDKAKRSGYVGQILHRAFDRELPPIDMDGLKIEVENAIGNVAQRLEPTAHNGLVGGSSPPVPTIYNVNHNADQLPPSIIFKNPPPGLLGEIAQFIYAAAPRPVPEIAIAGAIAFMSGICGRAYNVSKTGLNQYVLLLAKTGRGKESMQSGISQLIEHVSTQVPSIKDYVGPSQIASGPALFRHLSNYPQCLSIISEFGLKLQRLGDSGSGNSSNMSLRQMLLELYQKSGLYNVAPPSVYSEKEKNIKSIPSPAFSILAESTPHTFYKALTEELITEGFLPRFLVIEYDGKRVDDNINHGEVKPSNELIDKLAMIAANAQTVQNSSPRRAITVSFSEVAFKIAADYGKKCDFKINDDKANEVLIELWNRAHLKVLKLAAIVSVGINMWNPTIEKEHMDWAIGMVDADIKTLTEKFETGKIGANTQEIKQIEEVVRVIREYAVGNWEDVLKYCSAKDKKLHEDKVIPYGYISRRLVSVAAFRVDKMGATFAIQRTIKILMDRDYIQELSREQLRTRFGMTQKSYMITNVNLLKDEG